MALRRLRISSLRCIVEAELETHPERNFIYGPNGAGKTSLLEAVYVLGRGRSFRTRQLRRLVRKGDAGFAVFAELEREDGGAHRLGVAWRDGTLERRIDGMVTTGTAALARVLPVHVLEPGMHDLIQGPPTERRQFLDWGVFHVEHDYLEAWRVYRRALGQRNAALKRAASPAELAPWTNALIAAGRRVHALREAYVGTLDAPARRIGAQLLGLDVAIDYRPGWPADTTWEAALTAGERRDRELGITAHGPHRADVSIRLGGGLAQHEASRGQQKLTAAALVLAQSELAARAHGSTGAALLVDDPAAELDEVSLGRLLGAVYSAPGQLFVTALSPADVPASGGAAVFHVERGHLKAV